MSRLPMNLCFFISLFVFGGCAEIPKISGMQKDVPLSGSYLSSVFEYTLDDKEIESWMRLTRVLTHEIMNSVTPITSLSETLLSLHKNADKDIRSGLEVISSTGKGLIDFVESYRKFTHLPTPQPSLFYAANLEQEVFI